MTACKNDTEVDNPSSESITLLGSIGSVGVETRAGDGAISESYASPLLVNFARIDQSSTDGAYSLYSAATALDATRAGGSGSQSITFAATQSYLSDATYNSSKLVGWYPRAALASGVATFTVDGSTDIMLTNEVTGSASVKFSAAEQAFTFTHQLTQVQLKVYAESSQAILDWGTITSIKVKNQFPTCTLTLPSTVAFSGTAADLSLAGVTLPLTLPSGSAASISSGYAMIPDVAENATLQLEIVTSNGGTKTVALPVTTALEKSNAYVYTLKFTQTSISVVGTAQVGAWITATDNNYEVDASTGALNLSTNETANSYIARPNSIYKFNATVMGNGATTTGVTPEALAPVSASVLWQTADGLISGTPTLSNGYVTFSTNAAADGNAVIAVKDASNNVLWSWHIWITNYKPGLTANTGTNTTTYSFNSNIWMDRNLGATSVTVATASTFGMLYQWGRKDPFPNSSSATEASEPTLYGEKSVVVKEAVAVSNNLTNSIQNPATFYYNATAPNDWYSNTTTQNNNLWSGTKTIYDPCPPGWHFPAYSGSTFPWNGLTAASGTWNSGYSWSSIGYYPLGGSRDRSNGNFNNINNKGNYWVATLNGNNAYELEIANGSVGLGGFFYRASGFSIRCVKN
jgi:hypothetical protein